MRVTTKKTHQYAGKLRRAGDSYEATPEHARFLQTHGFVEIAPKEEKPTKATKYQTATLTAESNTETEKPKKEYKRRDLTSGEGKA